MAVRSKTRSSVQTFGDHEVIVPDENLRAAVLKGDPDPGEEDPVSRAEKALADLSTEFAAWMDMECDRLERARRDIVATGITKENKEALFHAAHDLKGEAATFGFPAVSAAADSLCRLLEYTPKLAQIPVRLLDQHVDAVRAIYREYARSDAQQLAGVLTQRLREVTDEFLLSLNRERPDVVAQIKSPPLILP